MLQDEKSPITFNFHQLLLKLEDNILIETVGISVEDDKGSVHSTTCVSSQVGFPLRCSFCATGKWGFSRNLWSHEIVEQEWVGWPQQIYKGNAKYTCCSWPGGVSYELGRSCNRRRCKSYIPIIWVNWKNMES
ncbi:unnamed protein product [Lathyrus sativus]|nr:unnamed protein product [Lathyrus sativus]CAK8066884.1 unnamed protein product [Lathyrus sativus]